MGNKTITSDTPYGSKTPTKKSLISKGGLSNIKNKNNSAQKDGLYAEDKLFENFDSKDLIINLDSNIFGVRLDSDPEMREFYLNCPQCGKLILDKGLSKEIM